MHTARVIHCDDGSNRSYSEHITLYIYLLINVFIPRCFAISFYFLRAYTIYYNSRLRIPMESALEIVYQTFVSILSGNFICIHTGVFVHVGLALAAERLLCPFARLTVAFLSDKKTRLSGARPNFVYAGKTLHNLKLIFF